MGHGHVAGLGALQLHPVLKRPGPAAVPVPPRVGIPLWLAGSLVLHGAERAAAASAGPCGGPWTPAACWQMGDLGVGLQASVRVAHVPGHSPRRAVHLHWPHPGGRFRAVGRKVAWAHSGSTAAGTVTAPETPASSRWFFSPGSAASAPEWARVSVHLQRNGPLAPPSQDSSSDSGQSQKCFPGAHLGGGAAAACRPHPELIRACS